MRFVLSSVGVVGLCAACGSDYDTAPPTTSPSTCTADVQHDLANCGACGHQCGSGEGISECREGKCYFVCQKGFAACGSDADGCSIDLETDRAHCGSCDHVCGGAETCIGGECQPEVLVAGLSNVRVLTIDGSKLLWSEEGSNGGNLRTCDAAACTPSVVVSNAKAVSAVALGVGGIYYAAYDAGAHNVYRCAEPPCDTVTLIDRLDSPSDAAPRLRPTPSGQLVYSSDGSSPQGGSVRAYAANGSPIFVANTVTRPRGLTVDGDRVFFADSSSDKARVLLCPVTGCKQDSVFFSTTANAAPMELALGPSDLYWIDASGDVRSCPRAGCPATGPTLVLDHGVAQTAIRQDILQLVGGLLYFATIGPTGRLVSCDPKDCRGTWRERVSTSSTPVVSGDTFYWVSPPSSIVRWLP